MIGVGKVAARMGRKALKSLPAVVLVAGSGALLPLGGAAADGLADARERHPHCGHHRR